MAVIGHVTEGRLLLVGSSMGGWIGLLAAMRLKQRVAGFVGLAAAPDFTERLMWQAMSPAEQTSLVREGRMEIPSEYGAPTTITMGLIEDGRRHLLLDAPIALSCPVRLLHGQRDPDVPWEQALTLAGRLEAEDVRVVLVKDGDHRLSRPQDLALLRDVLASLLRQDGA
jgi:pimeloyl-ACP methyl ester carboxylesterase